MELESVLWVSDDKDGQLQISHQFGFVSLISAMIMSYALLSCSDKFNLSRSLLVIYEL